MFEGVRILLVDDHAVMRSSLGLLLNTRGAEVVGEVSDGKSGITEALRLRPDVILMDITLPDMDGIEATRQICKAWPQARILALTMHSEETYLVPPQSSRRPGSLHGYRDSSGGENLFGHQRHGCVDP